MYPIERCITPEKTYTCLICVVGHYKYTPTRKEVINHNYYLFFCVGCRTLPAYVNLRKGVHLGDYQHPGYTRIT